MFCWNNTASILHQNRADLVFVTVHKAGLSIGKSIVLKHLFSAFLMIFK